MWTDTDHSMDRLDSCPRCRSATKYREPEDVVYYRGPKNMPDILTLACADPPRLQAPPLNNKDKGPSTKFQTLHICKKAGMEKRVNFEATERQAIHSNMTMQS
eukprot:4881125-Pyramimonas_sp.AAC.1